MCAYSNYLDDTQQVHRGRVLLPFAQDRDDCAFCGYQLDTTTYTFNCGDYTCNRRLCEWCATEIVCPIHKVDGVAKKEQKKGDERGSYPEVK